MRASEESGSTSPIVGLAFVLPFFGSPLHKIFNDAEDPVEGFPQHHQQQHGAVYPHTARRDLTGEQQG